MRVTFSKRWLSKSCKYVCKCGHKFTRVNRDYYTNNPFHNEKETIIKMGKEVASRKRACPKCKKLLNPQP